MSWFKKIIIPMLMASSLFGLAPDPGAVSRAQAQILRAWYTANHEHPYPGASAVQVLSAQTGLSREQVQSWLSARRLRLALRSLVPLQALGELPDPVVQVELEDPLPAPGLGAAPVDGHGGQAPE